VAERTEETSQSIGVLFQRYGVDIYNAGHAHEVTTTLACLSLTMFSLKLFA
jgi:hypothetical protein